MHQTFYERGDQADDHKALAATGRQPLSLSGKSLCGGDARRRYGLGAVCWGRFGGLGGPLGLEKEMRA